MTDHPRRRAPPPTRRLLMALGYALYLPLLAGFLLHTSPAGGGWRVLGRYSLPYVGLLIVLLLIGAAIPRATKALSRPTRLPSREGDERLLEGWRKVAVVCMAWLLGILACGVLTETALQVRGAMAGEWAPEDTRASIDDVFWKWPPREPPYSAWGFLGPNISLEKPRDTCRIFILGGSTSMVPNLRPEDQFSARLQALLSQARPHRRIEVVNAACPGHTTFHSLVKYALLLQEFHPDMLVIMHAVNDLDEGVPDQLPAAWQRPYERDYGHHVKYLNYLGRASGMARPQEALWTQSRALAFIVPALRDTLFSDLRPANARAEQERRVDAEEALARSLPSFKRNLRTLGELVRARGGRLIIASQPSMCRPAGIDGRVGFLSPAHEALAAAPVYRATAVATFRRYNDANRQVADELGIPFVDLEAAVPPQWEFFQSERDDGLHMNPAGCARAAQAYAAVILPLIPERTPPAPGTSRPSTFVGAAP